MAISRLAVSNPTSNTNILMYTGVRTILSSVIATNKSSDPATVRIWVVPIDQDNIDSSHSYITYDTIVSGKDSLETFRFPIMTGDKVYIRASSGDISFNLSGIDDTNIAGTELADLESDILSAQNAANEALVLALIDI
jgi:hypothetical protein